MVAPTQQADPQTANRRGDVHIARNASRRTPHPQPQARPRGSPVPAYDPLAEGDTIRHVRSVRHPLPARRSIRLATGEYVSGVYLVTIVTHLRRMTFGHVSSNAVTPSPLGALVAREIEALPGRRERTGVMESIVMPNHVHMVVWLSHSREHHELVLGSLEDNSLGSTIGGFKAGVTRSARRRGLVAPREPIWQRGFHEAILRTERSIIDACRYVERNPELWRWDPMRCR